MKAFMQQLNRKQDTSEMQYIGTYEATANHFQNALTPTGEYFWGIRRSALIEVEEGSSAEGRATPGGGGIVGKYMLCLI
jgi:hypothetical protein